MARRLSHRTQHQPPCGLMIAAGWRAEGCQDCLTRLAGMLRWQRASVPVGVQAVLADIEVGR